MDEKQNDDKFYKLSIDLYEELKGLVNKETLINTVNVMEIIIKLASIVELYPEIKGIEKRNLVLKVVKSFINNEMKSDELQISLLNFIDLFGGSAIDAFISLDKKTFFIKKIKHFFVCC